jgi:hypothetical protein
MMPPPKADQITTFLGSHFFKPIRTGPEVSSRQWIIAYPTRRYAEQGDYEMSNLAFGAMANLCRAYVNTKGKTFFTRHLMFDNPHSADTFINNTLEHLRQLSRLAISRRDEQQIEQIFRTFFALVRIFGVIDYATEGASKIHAHLAASYLGNEVQAIAAHNMPDVLMEGVRFSESQATYS